MPSVTREQFTSAVHAGVSDAIPLIPDEAIRALYDVASTVTESSRSFAHCPLTQAGLYENDENSYAPLPEWMWAFIVGYDPAIGKLLSDHDHGSFDIA